MNNLTFCINTAKNELPYLKLLFKSLYHNLSSRLYDIIVYVDTDKEGAVEFLMSQKEHFPNLKILKNPLPIPLGYQRNVNLLFSLAPTDIVTYLHSDMVIFPNYDLEILRHVSPNTILSSTRIEPPLHPSSGEKVTANFGLDPESFDFDSFNKESVRYRQDKITNYFFAPFTLYKNTWLDIGGHDTLFRRSREDSDIALRLLLNGCNFKQCWNAFVYHFTCTSSRGVGWYKEQNLQKTSLQQSADIVELKRFIRKWGSFLHPHTEDDVKSLFKYNISLNLTNVPDSEGYNIYRDGSIYMANHLFNKVYIDNQFVRTTLKFTVDRENSIANKILNISDDNWVIYNKYFNQSTSSDIFIDSFITDDVIVNATYTQFNSSPNIIQNIQRIIHENKDDGEGQFDCDGIVVTINKIDNVINKNIIVKNPSIQDIVFDVL